ncbi:MAG TPA: 30S ribosomal protein S8 [archaeon]|nr:30S ribosomal protein S8 [archaeon]
MLQDPLADALSTIKNAERIGKRECITRSSKLIKAVLKVMQEKGYIGAFEFIDDGKSGKFKIDLKSKVIDCNVIKPRFSVMVEEFEKWEKRYLPAKNVGILILSTSKGVIDHNKSRELHTGGKLLAFVY